LSPSRGPLAARAASWLPVAQGLAGILVAAALWQAVRMLGWIDPRDLPSALDVLQAAGADLASGELAGAIGDTLLSWALGLLLATMIGVALGVLLAVVAPVERAVRPILEFLRPIPSVALIPIALLTLGIGLQMQLAMIAFASVWPVLFSAKAGVESVDPRYFETGRIFGLTRVERLIRILLPAALPAIATGIRVASALALVIAITVEMLTGRPGLGNYLQTTRLNGLVPQMWAAIFAAGFVGFLLNSAFLALEARAMPWSPERRGR
jgi:ABC-type nitrate/sulfonate/bicarbonate transport system permease component